VHTLLIYPVPAIIFNIDHQNSTMSEEASSTPSVVTVRDATLADLQFLVDGNAAMALETEDLVLDKDTLRMGCAAMLNDRNKGFYLIADCEHITAGQLMVTYEHSDWRNGKCPPIHHIFHELLTIFTCRNILVVTYFFLLNSLK
jgi:hypothetical protein